MPTYTHTIGGKTYTFDSPTPLTPDEQRQEATIFYMEDTQGERSNLASKSAMPTRDEQAWTNRGNHDPDASIWKGVEEGATNLVTGLADTIAHPLTAAQNAWRAQVHQGELATEARKRGDYLESGGRDILAALPLLGPAAADIGEDLTQGVINEDPTALGRGGFNAALMFGPGAAKSVYTHGGNVADMGRAFATKYPGVMRTAAGIGEGYALHGGKGAAVGGLLGAMGAPTRLSDLKALIKDVTKKGGAEAAGEEAGEAVGAESAAQEAAEASAPKPTPRAAPKPITPPAAAPVAGQGTAMSSHPSPVQPRALTSKDFLTRDVAGWKPGSKFDPTTRTLSMPGRGNNVVKLRAGDESVMGLMRELGNEPPPGGYSSYPQPEGSSEAAIGLRQRASMAGERARTRPVKPEAPAAASPQGVQPRKVNPNPPPPNPGETVNGYQRRVKIGWARAKAAVDAMNAKGGQ